MNTPSPAPAQDKLSHKVTLTLIAAGGVILGAVGSELVKPKPEKPPSKADVEAVAEIRRIVEVAAQSGKGLSLAECQGIARAAAPTIPVAGPPSACPPDLQTRVRTLEEDNTKLRSEISTLRAGAQPPAPQSELEPSWKTSNSGRLTFGFKNIVIRAVPAGSGQFYTSATLKIVNSGSEPIEVAIDAIGGWPTLVVDGTTMLSDNRSISMPFFMNGTLIDCARHRQSRFATLKPGEPYTTSIGFAAQAAAGSMDTSQSATLVGSLLIRTPKSTECTNVSIPGADIRASLAK